MRILVVDDDPIVLWGMRRVMHEMRSVWQVDYATGGWEGLQRMNGGAYDIVVSDLQMPGLGGVDLLGIARSAHPAMVRFAMSGFADRRALIDAAPVAHQFFDKPCPYETLRSAILDAESCRDGLSPAVRARVTALGAFPVLQENREEFIRELASPSVTTDSVAGVVCRDVGLAATVLHLARWTSGRSGEKSLSVRRAVGRIGFDMLKAMASSPGLLKPFDEELAARGGVRAFYAGRTGAAGSAGRRRVGVAVNLVQGIGRLAVVLQLPREHERIARACAAGGVTESEAQREVLGTTYAEIGAALMTLWGIPSMADEPAASADRAPYAAGSPAARCVEGDATVCCGAGVVPADEKVVWNEGGMS